MARVTLLLVVWIRVLAFAVASKGTMKLLLVELLPCLCRIDFVFLQCRQASSHCYPALGTRSGILMAGSQCLVVVKLRVKA